MLKLLKGVWWWSLILVWIMVLGQREHVLYAEDKSIMLNEFLAVPSGTGYEWLELYNYGNNAIDASHWSVDTTAQYSPTALRFDSDAVTIHGELMVQPRSYLLIEIHTDMLADDTSDGLWLFNGDGVVIDSAIYTTPLPLPGQSYARIPDGGDWYANRDPTPNQSNNTMPTDTSTPTVASTLVPGASRLYINEVLALASDGHGDWVELYNAGNTTINLQGWSIKATGSIWMLESRTIAPGDFLIQHLEREFLPSGGGSVGVFNADNQPVGAIVSYPELDVNEVYARFPDASDTWIRSSTPSKGIPNPPPSATHTATPTEQPPGSASVTPTAGHAQSGQSATLLINELLAAPSPGQSEWVELYNPGKVLVDLAGWSIQRTSSSGAVQKHRLHDGVIAPHSLVVVECASGFLPNRGAQIELRNPAGQRVGSVSTYPALTDGQVYARIHDGSTLWTATYPASPGAPNMPPPPTATVLATTTPERSPTRNPHDSHSDKPPSSGDSNEQPITSTPAPNSGLELLPGYATERTATVTPIPTPRPPQPKTLLINELLAAPSPGQSEWVELYNTGSVAVTIDGWSIRRISGSGATQEQPLDAETIAPGSLVVQQFASGLLPNSGASIELLNASGEVVGGVVVYPALFYDQVYARTSDGGNQWSVDYPPSPGSTNTPPPPTATPTSTATSQPTSTPRPTKTTKPTSTPRPTRTTEPSSTPRPTKTTEPSSTPRPTKTTKPTSTPAPTSTSRPTRTSTPTRIATPDTSPVIVSVAYRTTRSPTTLVHPSPTVPASDPAEDEPSAELTVQGAPTPQETPPHAITAERGDEEEGAAPVQVETTVPLTSTATVSPTMRSVRQPLSLQAGLQTPVRPYAADQPGTLYRYDIPTTQPAARDATTLTTTEETTTAPVDDAPTSSLRIVLLLAGVLLLVLAAAISFVRLRYGH